MAKKNGQIVRAQFRAEARMLLFSASNESGIRDKRSSAKNMTSPVFEKITVPRDWTGERDIQEFVNRFGESDDYFGEVLARIDDGYDRLEHSLDHMLALAGHSDTFTAHITDRVSTLRRHFLSKHCADSHRAPFLQHLDYCWFALIEYFRLMPRYVKAGDSNWLSPLIRLSDHLAAAADGLARGTSMPQP